MQTIFSFKNLVALKSVYFCILIFFVIAFSIGDIFNNIHKIDFISWA